MIVNKPQFDVDSIQIGSVCVVKYPNRIPINTLIVDVSPFKIKVVSAPGVPEELQMDTIKIEEILSNKIKLKIIDTMEDNEYEGSLFD